MLIACIVAPQHEFCNHLPIIYTYSESIYFLNCISIKFIISYQNRLCRNGIDIDKPFLIHNAGLL